MNKGTKVIILLSIVSITQPHLILCMQELEKAPLLEKHTTCLHRFFCNKEATKNTLIGGGVGLTTGCFLFTVASLFGAPLGAGSALAFVTSSSLSGLIIGRSGVCTDYFPKIAATLWCTQPPHEANPA